MRRETVNVLLVLLGGAMLKIALNGSYLRYVKPALFPWLVASGVVMLLLAAFAIGRDVVVWSGMRRPRPVDDPGAGAATQISPEQSVVDEQRVDEQGIVDKQGVVDAAEHDHHQPRSPWLLVLPVLAIFLIAPPALGADTVARAGGRSVAGQQAPGQQKSTGAIFDKLPGEEVIPLRMSDFVTRAVWDETRSLDNRTVKLTGFAVHENGGAVYLARLVITCCAADAMPVKVKLDSNDLAGLKDDQWFDITGRVQPKTATESNGYVPTFTVSAIRPVPVPADPYEY